MVDAEVVVDEAVDEDQVEEDVVASAGFWLLNGLLVTATQMSKMIDRSSNKSLKYIEQKSPHPIITSRTLLPRKA